MDIYQARIAALKALIGESSLRDFADRHDMDPSYLSQMLNGHRNMGERAAANIERKMHLLPGTLTSPGHGDAPDPGSAAFSVAAQLEMASSHAVAEAGMRYNQQRMLPVIGYVQAGEFCEAVDNFQPGDADEWIEAGGAAGPRAFVLIVEGFSMYPKLAPGEKVVFDPDQQWDAGSIVLAKRLSDQSVTIKQLCREGNEWFLHATNPDWPEKYIKLNEEWMVCARARRKIVEL
ncbi:S24 family peptidase [Stutzerimonas balearica]|uniref:S24 family peptidase n=1 Tax=Stutzerimonas balearica TaxID=74829 RepID=UPI00190BC29C|nr:S24 family peptidase [Stutzerimonas balearica]MBK3748724.1 XRE family transcriptional regulator [Stutzerimonas balearica]MBK3826921.1 XRE family transcriptional regulator [Stutzerimonas balearica]MBK3856611.1 XRE family transcriptional regulator [Stutzerimonas balearica]